MVENKMKMKNLDMQFIVSVVLGLAIAGLLVMVIWNNVLIKRVSGLDKLTYWDSLAVAVFMSMVGVGVPTCLSKCVKA